LNSGGLKNGPNRTTGNDTSTCRSGFKHNQTSAKFAMNLMGNTVVSYRYFLHIFTGLFNPLANGLGNLIGLAQSVPNFSIAVTDNANRTKTEPPSTFYNFGGTINEDDFFNKLVFRAFILKV